MNTFNAINTKYELGITHNEFYPIADKWAHDKAKASGGFFSKLFSSGFKGLFSIVVSVVSVVATWGASLALNAIKLVAAVANVANTAYGIHTQANLLNLNIRLKNLSSSLESLKNLRESDKSSAQLTQSLTYNPYEIFANGSIYRQRAAGDLNAWSSSLPPDCNAGILGKVQQDATDEQIQNRAHIDKAGNIDFFDKQLNAPFPLAKGGISYAQIYDGIKNHFAIDQKRINEGFLELNKQDFNYIGTAQSIYNRVYDEQLVPFFVRMQNEDFLEKLKNYPKALCADFDYIWKQKLDPRDKSQEPIKAEDLKAYRIASAKIQAQSQDLNTLARDYFQSVQFLTAALLKYAKNFYTYPRIPFILPTPPLPQRGNQVCINANEYYLNGAEYVAQKEEKFKAIAATNTLKDYQLALQEFHALKLVKNPHFKPIYKWQQPIPTTPKSITSALEIKGLEYSLQLFTAKADFINQTTSQDFVLPSKVSLKPLSLKTKAKDAILQYERFILECFLDTPLALEAKGKQRERHNTFYVPNYNQEPFIFFSPLPQELWEEFKEPLPKNPKLEGFDFSSL